MSASAHKSGRSSVGHVCLFRSSIRRSRHRAQVRSSTHKAWHLPYIRSPSHTWFSQHDVRSQITDRVTVLKLDHLHTKHGTCRTSDLHRTHWTGRRPRSPDAVRTTHNTRHRSPPTTCGTRSARLRTTPHGSAARLRAHRTLTAVGTSRRRRLGDGCRPRRLTAPHGADGSTTAVGRGGSRRLTAPQHKAQRQPRPKPRAACASWTPCWPAGGTSAQLQR